MKKNNLAPLFISFCKDITEAKTFYLWGLISIFIFNVKSHALNLSKEKNKVSSVPMMRIKMNGLVNSLDETVLYYQTGATNGFDSEYDAYKLLGPNNAPYISQEYNSILFSINGINPVAETFSINILATTPTTGNFTITATDFTQLPTGTCVYLHDLISGITVNILTTPYSFVLSNTTTTSRFVLSITHYQLPITSKLIQPTCEVQNGGRFTAKGEVFAPWNYTWKDSTGTIIKTVLNSYTSDSLDNLSNGNYKLEISSANNRCYSKDTTFKINSIILPDIYFTSPDTIISSPICNYTVLNQSSKCATYVWDFGDGIGLSNDMEPTYSYSIAGVYITKLKGLSATGCIDSVQKSVTVLNLTTHLMAQLNHKIKLIDLGNNYYKIESGKYTSNELFILVNALDGKSTFKQQYALSENGSTLLDLNGLNSGIYILNIIYKDQVLLNSKILIK